MSTRLMRYCRSLDPYLSALEVSLNAYATIVEPVMGFPRERELESLSFVANYVDCDQACLALQRFVEQVQGSEVCVVTPGSIVAGLVKEAGCKVVIATDSELESLAANGIRPAALVGDADQSLRLLHMALALETPYFLHVHGDNTVRAAEVVRLTRGRGLILTAQVDNPFCTVPVGAFTDGDRAAVLAMVFSAGSVVTSDIGTQPVCGHKDYCDPRVKSLKLELGRRVLHSVAAGLGYRVDRADGLLRLTKSEA
ncbi:MAG: hypothetical protein ACP5FT_03575 [Acidilobus sp.]